MLSQRISTILLVIISIFDVINPFCNGKPCDTQFQITQPSGELVQVADSGLYPQVDSTCSTPLGNNAVRLCYKPEIQFSNISPKVPEISYQIFCPKCGAACKPTGIVTDGVCPLQQAENLQPADTCQPTYQYILEKEPIIMAPKTPPPPPVQFIPCSQVPSVEEILPPVQVITPPARKVSRKLRKFRRRLLPSKVEPPPTPASAPDNSVEIEPSSPPVQKVVPLPNIEPSKVPTESAQLSPTQVPVEQVPKSVPIVTNKVTLRPVAVRRHIDVLKDVIAFQPKKTLVIIHVPRRVIRPVCRYVIRHVKCRKCIIPVRRRIFGHVYKMVMKPVPIIKMVMRPVRLKQLTKVPIVETQMRKFIEPVITNEAIKE